MQSFPIALALLLPTACLGQVQTGQVRTGSGAAVQPVKPVTAETFLNPPAPRAATNPSTTPSDYKIAPGDQLTLVVPDLDDYFGEKAFRVDTSGGVSLPFAGHINVAGMTPSQAETEVASRLKVLKDPQVSVSVVSVVGQPVSLLGAFMAPGIRQLDGSKTLFEVLSLGGGLRPDAGYLIHITRDVSSGPIPLPDDKLDAAGKAYTAAVKVKTLVSATDPSQNIVILPGDMISVPKADVVYAIGSIVRPGGYQLDEHESLSALQVVSLANGLQKTAAPKKAMILRNVAGSTKREEIPVDLKAILSGKGNDVQLRPEDILFVPNSNAKSAGYRTLDVLTGTAGTAVLALK